MAKSISAVVLAFSREPQVLRFSPGFCSSRRFWAVKDEGI
jgi:hypothetical protein